MDKACVGVTTERAKWREKLVLAFLSLSLIPWGLEIFDKWSLLVAHLNLIDWILIPLIHLVALIALISLLVEAPKGTPARLRALFPIIFVLMSWSMDLSRIGKFGADSMVPAHMPSSAMLSWVPVAPQVLRIGEGVAVGLLQESSKPIYPPAAKTAGVHGVVKLRVRIGSDGRVAQANLVSGHPLLVPPAIDAVMGYVYKPFMLNGTAVDVITTVEIEFESDGMVHSQQATRNDDIEVSVEECRTIQMTLNARTRASGNVSAADDFTAAGQACDRLRKAISTSDPEKFGLQLRPSAPF
jgi:Gram-negative bacterial TonB protein C-terminal